MEAKRGNIKFRIKADSVVRADDKDDLIDIIIGKLQTYQEREIGIDIEELTPKGD